MEDNKMDKEVGKIHQSDVVSGRKAFNKVQKYEILSTHRNRTFYSNNCLELYTKKLISERGSAMLVLEKNFSIKHSMFK